MKCWNSAFNAQGSRLIIVVVRFGASEIICSSSGGAQEKGKTGWNLVYHQNWWFSENSVYYQNWWFSEFLSPIEWMLMYFFSGFFFKIPPCVWPNSGFWCCVFLTLRITLISMGHWITKKCIEWNKIYIVGLQFAY